ncbi:hypothetical protein GALMADRAFT_132948 [Galerina marginata CBS 339.88]|uniref:Protein kinase domain-containing protein n=1 Tax=Galerina marginata (strain CBS 339.88) TaxID=685588 RepID=A0A067TK53_GALM3|nr:hypothetical protein GALMADRAFT_132948 [Galerina marginata CBS 339.88]
MKVTLRNAFQRPWSIKPTTYLECCCSSKSSDRLPLSSASPVSSSSTLSYVTDPSLSEADFTASHTPTWELEFLCSGGYGRVYSTNIHFNDGGPPLPAVMKVVQLNKHAPNFIWQARAEIEAMKRIRRSPHPFLVDQPAGMEDEELTWWCGENASLYMLLNLYYTDLNAIKCYWSEIRGMPRKYIKNMIYELVSGLNHIHSLGIIHGDIKPSNIFVDSCGHCRIGDFGGSMALSTQAPVDGRYFCANFPVSMTPSFQPPETIFPANGSCYVFNESADFWSLGITIWDVVFPRCEAVQDLQKFADPRDRGAYSEKVTYLIKEMERDTAERWPPTFVREFTLKCCKILPQDRFTGAAAAEHVVRWNWNRPHESRTLFNINSCRNFHG